VIRLAVRVRREQADVALAELLDLAPGGVEEVDRGELVEYAVYGAPGELPALPAVEAAAGGALVEVEATGVPDGWEERWKRFHRPVLVEERLYVRPPWERPLPGAVDLVIDPGRAFGTGAHPTTRLCLGLLAQMRPAGAFADLGCGSGVLAIAAARLGWSPVVGVDHEQAAIEATRANAAANGVALQAGRMDLRREPPPTAPTAAANLAAGLLRGLAARFPDPPPRTLIASGLLEGEAGGVAAAFAARGLAERERRTADGWVALRFERLATL
jgi:ribosomal protein L11 methyltransferase